MSAPFRKLDEHPLILQSTKGQEAWTRMRRLAHKIELMRSRGLKSAKDRLSSLSTNTS